MAGLDETLTSIATRLNELAERHLTEQISTEQYAFDLDALLADVPAPAPPDHLKVLLRINDWKASGVAGAWVRDSWCA